MFCRIPSSISPRFSASRRRLGALAAAMLLAPSWPLLARAAASPPPAAQLFYETKVSAKGMAITIDSEIEWAPAGERYRVVNRAQHLLLGSLNFESSGRLTADGLAPERYVETRRKRVKEVTIDRQAKQVRFSGGETAAAPEALQDRTSVMMQLASMARADAGAFVAGKSVQLPVAGSSRVQMWTFEVVGEETLRAPMGQLRAVHLKRLPRPGRDGADEQTADVWLAPERNWLPVRIHLREANGDEFDQVVARITP